MHTKAKAEKAGIKEAGGTADLYQVAETLPDEVLTMPHAPPKSDTIPVMDAAKLEEYNTFSLRHPHPLRHLPRAVACVLGLNQQTMDGRQVLGQVCGLVRE